MFKSISVLWLFVFLVQTLTAPIDDYSVVVLNSYNEPYDGDVSKGYKFGYELSDGQTRSEVGSFVKNANDVDSLLVEGSYGFNAPEGESFVVSYIANERGYQPRVRSGGIKRVLQTGPRSTLLTNKFGAGKIDLRYDED